MEKILILVQSADASPMCCSDALMMTANGEPNKVHVQISSESIMKQVTRNNQNTQRRQTILLAAITAIFSLSVMSCNRVPSDMYPNSVGAFQFKEGSKSYKDEKGYTNFYGNYVLPDNSKISCSAFDAASDEEAAMTVTGSGFRDDAHQPKPIPDKRGKQIGLKLLVDEPGRRETINWNIGKRAYWCTTEKDGTEKTLEEFFNNWQSQTSK